MHMCGNVYNIICVLSKELRHLYSDSIVLSRRSEDALYKLYVKKELAQFAVCFMSCEGFT